MRGPRRRSRSWAATTASSPAVPGAVTRRSCGRRWPGRHSRRSRPRRPPAARRGRQLGAVVAAAAALAASAEAAPRRRARRRRWRRRRPCRRRPGDDAPAPARARARAPRSASLWRTAAFLRRRASPSPPGQSSTRMIRRHRRRRRPHRRRGHSAPTWVAGVCAGWQRAGAAALASKGVASKGVAPKSRRWALERRGARGREQVRRAVAVGAARRAQLRLDARGEQPL